MYFKRGLMSKITKIATVKGRGKTVRVFLDGQPALSLLARVAADEGLQVGQELSAGQVAALARSDRDHCCLEAATRLLGYRPRSEAEIRQRLQRRGFDSGGIERTIAHLKEKGLVDDTAFARFWTENRELFRPRSQRLTRLELQRKGLPGEIIEQAVSEVSDSDSAYRAALSQARRLSGADDQGFRRRLGEYLRRRGFGYEVINHTVERIWQECRGSPV
jgi:regulatory protein